MRGYTGTKDPVVTEGGEVNLIDVVVHLGREARFGGWGDPEWTVLHHSMFVALIYTKLADTICSEALIHDAHEAWTGDIPKPIKNYVEAGNRGSLAELEGEYDGELRKFLGLDPEPSKGKYSMIRRCDETALLIESVLFGPPESDCRGDVKNLEARIADVYTVMPNFDEVCARLGKKPPWGYRGRGAVQFQVGGATVEREPAAATPRNETDSGLLHCPHRIPPMSSDMVVERCCFCGEERDMCAPEYCPPSDRHGPHAPNVPVVPQWRQNCPERNQ